MNSSLIQSAYSGEGKLRFELSRSEIDIDVTRSDATVFSFNIINETGHETKHDIWVKCKDNIFWQDNWYSFDAKDSLSVNTSASQGSISGEPLRDGLAWVETDNGQMLSVTLTNMHRREIEIRLAPGIISQARAGRYTLEICIESHGHLENSQHTAPGERENSPITESKSLTFVATILPYYNWMTKLEPQRVRVGFFKRKATVNLHVTNSGNDWIYLDLAAQEITDALITLPGERLAIPPANLGEREWHRTFPFQVRTFKKTVRGAEHNDDLKIAVTAQHAPTVSPAAALLGARGKPQRPLNPANVTHANSANLSKTSLNAAKLVYAPPIPASVTGIFKVLRDNAVGIVMAIIGLSMAATIIWFGMQLRYQQAMKFVHLKTGTVFGAKCEIEVPYVIGSDILFVDSRTGQTYTHFIARWGESGIDRRLTSIQNAAKTENRKFIFVPINADSRHSVQGYNLNGTLNKQDYKNLFLVRLQAGVPYKVQVRRPIPIIGNSLTPAEAGNILQIDKKVVPKPAPVPVPSVGDPENQLGNKVRGDTVEIEGENLGKKGVVIIGDQKLSSKNNNMVDWSPNVVKFIIPATLSAQGNVSISLQPAGSTKRIKAGSVSIVEPTPEPTDPNVTINPETDEGGGATADGDSGVDPDPVRIDDVADPDPIPEDTLPQPATEQPQRAPEPSSRNKPRKVKHWDDNKLDYSDSEIEEIKKDYSGRWDTNPNLIRGQIRIQGNRVTIGTSSSNW